MASPPKRGRGRPPDYVTGPDGKLVVGLSFHKASGRYYASHSDPRVYFGTDRTAALSRFWDWQAKQSGSANPALTITVARPKRGVIVGARLATESPPPEGAKVLPRSGPHPLRELFENPRADTWYQFRASDLIEAVREMIYADKRRAARVFRMPELEELGIVKHEPAPTVAKIWESYLKDAQSRGKVKKPEDAKKAKGWWDEFCRMAGATTVADIDEAGVQKYLDTKNGESRKNRHITIAAILRYRHKIGSQHPDLIRCHQLARMLRKPPSNGTAPKPISREDFETLLSTPVRRKGNQKGLWEALYLVSLNLGWYPVDCVTCPKSAVNLDTGAVVFDRGKTRMPRVGVLWPRSIEALKAYWAANPKAKASPLLFVDNNGHQLDTRDIDKAFARRRKRAELDGVNFADLRDGAQTRAIEEGANPLEVDILLGHKAPGVRDNYLRRGPLMVQGACAAIHRHYFGSDPWQRINLSLTDVQTLTTSDNKHLAKLLHQLAECLISQKGGNK